MDPPDIFGALVDYVASSLSATAWFEEVPEQTDPTSRQLPFVTLEGDMNRDNTFEKSFTDGGELTFHCFAVGDDAARTMGLSIVNLFAEPTTWPQIPIDAAEFEQVLTVRYGLHTEPETDRDANTVYRYDVVVAVIVNGKYL